MNTDSLPPRLPALSDAERLRGRILQATLSNLRQAQKQEQIVNIVSDYLHAHGKFYHHADRKDFDTAMFFDADRGVLLCLRSDEFQAWLSDLTSINRADHLFKRIIAHLETEAITSVYARGIVPAAYWANRGGKIYLSNGNGKMARITAEGVAMVANGTDDVLFAANKTLARWELVAPKDPFATCAVFRELNCVATHGKLLLQLFLLTMPADFISKPLLALIGGVGSGKTRTAKAIAELYGIPFRAVKVDERKESDFWPALNEGGFIVFDNVDTKNRWLPDALATAATDGCSHQRRLYTNSEMVTLKARAWVAITSANPTFASDPGLADRPIVVRLVRRTGDTKDEALSKEIAEHRDAGLSFIAHTLSRALADTSDIPLDLNARHPDFAAFALRVGRALGREKETLHALRAAEADKSQFCVENDPVGFAVVGLVRERGTFTGTAADLSYQLKDDELPWLTPRKLSKRLSALWPHLQSVMEATKETAHAGAFLFKLGPLKTDLSPPER